MNQEVGFVKEVKGSVLSLDGLPTAKINDLLAGDHSLAFVSGLRRDRVEALLLEGEEIHPGQKFAPTGKTLSIPMGSYLLGRAIDSLGRPIDAKSPFPKNTSHETLSIEAPGMEERKLITDQFATGIAFIDTLIPLGKGQRELVIGDGRSGKTGFLLDVIINQKKTGVVCVYGFLGKPSVEVKNVFSILEKHNAMAHTIIVASFSTSPGPLVFLTPQTVFAVAAFFQKQGRDVLVILDDMGAHAKTYREIALLLERPPGREAYPGDIFFQHAHLLERAGNFNPSAGSGSITALPVIELDMRDFTDFIPTNLMSMTDGHFLFRASLYNRGRWPAIDLFLSVSRVGQQTQEPLQRDLAFKIKQLLSRAEALSTVASFSRELPLPTQILLFQKEMFESLFIQPRNTLVEKGLQTVLLALPLTKFAAENGARLVKVFKENEPLAFFAKIPDIKALAGQVFQLKTLDDLFSKADAVLFKNKDKILIC